MTLSVLAPKYLAGLGLSGWERSEDFLTGEFFGLLRYLPGHVGANLFAGARTLENVAFADWFGELASSSQMHITLWPDLSGGIPDVRLRFADPYGLAIADVLIEVKLYAGASRRLDDPRHQLARYIRGLATEPSAERSPRCAVVYVTLERSAPKKEIDQAIKDAEEDGGVGDVKLFWLSWYDVADGLRDAESGNAFKGLASHEAAAFRDLRGILAARNIRTDAELEHFPLPSLGPLRDIGAWIRRWPRATEVAP